jgi:hypothetical protein
MKNFLIIVVLSFITSLSASASYRADDIDGEIISTVLKKVSSAQIKADEKERIITEELFNKLNGNNNAILSLAKHINSFPGDTDNTLGYTYTRLGVALTVIRSLTEQGHTNFNFSLKEKNDILQSLATELSKTYFGVFKSSKGGGDYSISPVGERCSYILELCGTLLSEKGQSQLMNKR